MIAAGNDGGPADDGLAAIPGNIEYVITVGHQMLTKIDGTVHHLLKQLGD